MKKIILLVLVLMTLVGCDSEKRDLERRIEILEKRIDAFDKNVTSQENDGVSSVMEMMCLNKLRLDTWVTDYVSEDNETRNAFYGYNLGAMQCNLPNEWHEAVKDDFYRS